MATMNEVVAYLDRIKPNVFTDEDKYRWISSIEGRVAREVYGEEAEPLKVPDDADTELRVPHPYDDIYYLYAGAMVDFHNREYDEYNNGVMMFQDLYEQFKAWYIRNNAHGKALNFRNVMG